MTVSSNLGPSVRTTEMDIVLEGHWAKEGQLTDQLGSFEASTGKPEPAKVT